MKPLLLSALSMTLDGLLIAGTVLAIAARIAP